MVAKRSAVVCDVNTYAKGVKVSDTEMAALNIKADVFHPEWNYTIEPRPAEVSR